MLRKVVVSVMMLSLAACVISCGSLPSMGGLPSLESSIVLKEVSVAGQKKIVYAPYGSTINYYGFIKPGQAPDATVGGKKTYYLYVWVPAVIAEMGVRMISPTGELGEPKADDIQSADFKAAKPEEKKMPNWFDTWVRVERMAAIMPNQIAKAAKGKALQNLGDDDDSDNTYNETRHAKYNSLKRIAIPNMPKSFDDLSKIDTKKLLVRGLYRISFTTYKVGEVKGSFVATVGLLFPPGIPGVSPLISNNPAELEKAAAAAEEELKKKMAGAAKKK